MILTVTAMGSGATASSPHAHHQADRSRISTASATHQQRISSEGAIATATATASAEERAGSPRRLFILAVAAMITRWADHPCGNRDGRQGSVSSSR